MGGHLLDGEAETGGPAAEALRADAQLVDGRQKLFLEVRVIGVGVRDVQRAEQSFLGEIGHFIKAAAHADAQHDGRAGVGAGQLDRLDDELLEALHAVGGLEHLDAAHVLAAEALGGDGDGAAVTVHQMHRDGGGGVVAGVAPAQRVGHDALAQIAVGVAPPYALVDRSLKAAIDMDVCTQLHEDAGHAGILTDGQILFFRRREVRPEQVKGVLCQRPGLFGPGLVQCFLHVPGQAGVGLDAEAGHGVRDLLRGNGSHRSSLRLQAGHAALTGSFCHSVRHSLSHAGVEGTGDDVLFAAVIVGDEVGDGVGGGQLHLVVDVAGADAQCALEEAREAEDVVDLIREVAAAGGHDADAAGLGLVGHDLGGGVGHGKDNGVLVHGPAQLGGQDTGLGHADEDVCARKSFFQAAPDLAGVGHFTQPVLVGLGAVAALVQGAELVHGDDVLRAGGHQHLDDSRTGSAGAVQDDVDVLHLLAHHAQGVDEGGSHDDGRAVLVIVEDGDVQLTLQGLFDLKALGALDVLEVDAAEGGGDGLAGRDDAGRVVGVDADGEGIHAAELLEEHSLALHDRQTGLWADVTQTQHGGAVGVPSAGQGKGTA